ncbi:hypothetical protein, partial [Shouchella clausii]|uniref:hypothetical protein n=2 Tax=Shouchella clausii TaxID=79880 RepID=UPI001C528507
VGNRCLSYSHHALRAIVPDWGTFNHKNRRSSSVCFAVGQGSAEVVAREQKNRLEKRIRVYSTGEGEQ